MNRYSINQYELLKEECLEYLGGKKCWIPNCGNRSLPTCCYDFHHEIGAKEEEISKIIGRKRYLDDELKMELKKCAIVCANCHRMITFGYIDNKTLQSLFNDTLKKGPVLPGEVWRGEVR